MSTAGLDDVDYNVGITGAGYDGSAYGGFDGGYDGDLYGGDESSSSRSWAFYIVWSIVLLLVLIVVWKISDFRHDRVCVSTDLREYWPSTILGPAVPAVSYLPALSQFIPSEKLTPPEINRTRTDEKLARWGAGY